MSLADALRQHVKRKWKGDGLWLAAVVCSWALPLPWSALAVILVGGLAGYDLGRMVELRAGNKRFAALLADYGATLRQLMEAERAAMMYRHEAAVLRGDDDDSGVADAAPKH